MSAIEYGSHYWCVLLNAEEGNAFGELVHLHADDLAIDQTGTLTFRSAGWRPACSEPKQEKDKDKEDKKDSEKTEGGDSEDSQNTKESGMIYMAFAPGTWRVVYAAKLQDGSPASVEHWNTADGGGTSPGVVPANSGAQGYTPVEQSALATRVCRHWGVSR